MNKPWNFLGMLGAFSAFIAVIAQTGCKKAPPGPVGSGPAGFAIQVVIAEVKRQTVSETLSLVGTVTANEMVELKSETEGTIEEILFKEGQPVKEGELLLRLDESKFASVVAEAEANFKLSQANFERSGQLFRDKLISLQEHEQMSALFQANQAGLALKKRQWKDARITAPFNGIISSRSISPGQVIGKDTTLTWLVDLDPVKVEVGVPERYLSQLAIGQNIEITVAAYPGRKFAGPVFFVAPFVEVVTRTALVKARIPNPRQELKPGMFANLELRVKLKEDGVVIPESAVVASGDRTLVYVIGTDDTVQLRPVELGLRLAGHVEVASGLHGGERIVAEGIQKVRPGVKVTAGEAEKAGKRESGKAGEGGKTGAREP